MQLSTSTDSTNSASSSTTIPAKVSPTKRYLAEQTGLNARALSDVIAMQGPDWSRFATAMLSYTVTESNINYQDWERITNFFNERASFARTTRALRLKAKWYLQKREERYQRFFAWYNAGAAGSCEFLILSLPFSGAVDHSLLILWLASVSSTRQAVLDASPRAPSDLDRA